MPAPGQRSHRRKAPSLRAADPRRAARSCHLRPQAARRSRRRRVPARCRPCHNWDRPSHYPSASGDLSREESWRQSSPIRPAYSMILFHVHPPSGSGPRHARRRPSEGAQRHRTGTDKGTGPFSRAAQIPALTPSGEVYIAIWGGLSGRLTHSGSPPTIGSGDRAYCVKHLHLLARSKRTGVWRSWQIDRGSGLGRWCGCSLPVRLPA